MSTPEEFLVEPGTEPVTLDFGCGMEDDIFFQAFKSGHDIGARITKRTSPTDAALYARYLEWLDE